MSIRKPAKAGAKRKKRSAKSTKSVSKSSVSKRKQGRKPTSTLPGPPPVVAPARESVADGVQFRLLLDSAPDAIITMDPEGKISIVNHQAEATFGYSREELIGQPIELLIPERFRGGHGKHREGYTAHPSRRPMGTGLELYARRKDGSEFPADVSLSPYKINGETQVVSIIRDTTEAVKALHDLNERTTSLNSLIENNPLGIVVLDESFRIQMCNRQFERMFGYAQDGVLGRNLDELIAPEGRQKEAEKFTHQVRSGKSIHFISKRRRKDGVWIDVEVHGVALVVEGEMKGHYALYQDVTDRKAAEKALRLSQFSIEHSSDAAFWISPEGKFLYVNDAACRLTGYRRKELTGMTVADISPPDSGASWSRAWRETKKTGWRLQEFLGMVKGGGTVPVEVSTNYVNFDGDEYLFAFARDISSRREVEEALRLTQFSVDRAATPVYWVDSAGKIVYQNDKAADYLGHSVEEMQSFHVWDLNPLQNRSKWPAHFEKIKREGAVTFESAHRARDGRMIPVEVNSNYVSMGGREYVCAFVFDLTERKQAESALRLTQFAMDTVALGVFWLAPDSRVLYANKQACSYLGYSSEEMRFLRASDISPAITEELWRERWEELKQKGSVTLEAAHHTKDGRVIPVQTQANFLESDGKEYAVIFVFDISDRKKAEEELRASESKYRDLVENAYDIVFTVDLEGTYTSVNKAAEEISGYSREEIIGKGFREIISAATAHIPMESLQRKLEGHDAPPYVIELMTKSGKMVPIEVSSRLIYEDGKPAGAQGVARDITERKRAARLLVAEKEVLEVLAEGGELSSVLEKLTRSMEEQTVGLLCSILLSSEDGLHLHTGASPTLPEEYNRAIDGMEVGPSMGSCGTAAFSKEPVIVSDVQRDPLWEDFKDLANRFDLRACWSWPIFSGKGRVLGTFALYAREPREPDDPIRHLVERGVNLAGLVIESVRTRAALDASEKERTLVLDNIDEVVYAVRAGEHGLVDGRLEFSTRQLEGSLGYTVEDIFADTSNWLKLIHPDDMESFHEATRRVLRTKQPGTRAYRIQKRDSAEYAWLEDRIVPRIGTDGRVEGIFGVIRDVTEKKELEQQLFQAQKMEAVGQLAGGVAHDFNNLLMVIRGFTELMQAQQGDEGPDARHLAEIQKAADRATALTQQLLAFSRKQVMHLEVIDLNKAVAGMERMLHRLIGENIRLKMIPGGGNCRIKADPVQVEQVVLNLVLNARDAMPQGGALTLTVSEADINERFVARNVGARVGRYVALRVMDSGHGMDVETVGRIFEPFFTTKEAGKGTGLGLATAYGIVKQSDGYIQVESEVDKGTWFDIYFPRVEELSEEERPAEVFEAVEKGSGVILVVEDEEAVCDLTCEFLRENGYEVLRARDGLEALQVAEQYRGKIDLLLTDVVMPGINGRDLAEKLARVRPGIRVMYVSGYTDSEIAQGFLGDVETVFLQKPFPLDALAGKVREVLSA